MQRDKKLHELKSVIYKTRDRLVQIEAWLSFEEYLSWQERDKWQTELCDQTRRLKVAKQRYWEENVPDPAFRARLQALEEQQYQTRKNFRAVRDQIWKQITNEAGVNDPPDGNVDLLLKSTDTGSSQPGSGSKQAGKRELKAPRSEETSPPSGEKNSKRARLNPQRRRLLKQALAEKEGVSLENDPKTRVDSTQNSKKADPDPETRPEGESKDHCVTP